MKHNPYYEHNTMLTPAQKLRAAVAVLLDGMDQHKVAAMFGVNPGRVNKAVSAVREAIERKEREDITDDLTGELP
jgi:DNA-directed RNA polymerase specialized sigma24 family protein